MKLGNLLIEAKLTQGDFQTARAELVWRYRDLEDVFHLEMLPFAREIFRSYQLIRGVLAAAALNCSFCVLCESQATRAYRGLVSRGQGGSELQIAVQTEDSYLAGASPGASSRYNNASWNRNMG